MLTRSPFAAALLTTLVPWFDDRAAHDERRLEKAFGAEYVEYRDRVPRWIGLPLGLRSPGHVSGRDSWLPRRMPSISGSGRCRPGARCRPRRCGRRCPSRRRAGAVARVTVDGRNSGLRKPTSTVSASGSRPCSAASARALIHMPCAMARLKPKRLRGQPGAGGSGSRRRTPWRSAGRCRRRTRQRIAPSGRSPTGDVDVGRRGPVRGRRTAGQVGRPAAPHLLAAGGDRRAQVDLRAAAVRARSARPTPRGRAARRRRSAGARRSGCARAPGRAAPAGTTRSLISATCSGNASTCG